ncbi:MAG: hypothetical protein KTR24_17520 [Saprospiraceae bacterium]|nr:hypothetical protein [Saprospiraceae bacterium]
MLLNKLPLLLIALATSTLFGQQYDVLTVQEDIVLPEDSLESASLLHALDAFLSGAHKNSLQHGVPNAETQILVDELIDIPQNDALDDSTFFTPHLTNVVPLDTSTFGLHVAYLGVNEQTPILRAHFEFIAKRIDGDFTIESPLAVRTQNWKSWKLQNHVFHFPYDIDEEKLQRFADFVIFCDTKLDNNEKQSHYYLCKDEINPLELFGVHYKSDYNGDPTITRWSSGDKVKLLWVANEARVYDYNLHDLWHNRLGQVVSRRDVHRRVDCHIATLYGGLWGLSWEELFPMFSKRYVVESNVDWLDHKWKKSHFVTQGGRKNYTDDFVGALLIRKIEREQNFEGVWKLLKTKRTKDEAEYFSVLESLVGITKDNYNLEVNVLIEEEMKNLGLMD